MRIFKYEVEVGARQRVSMPAGAVVLGMQQQGECLVMWAIVDPSAKLVYRAVSVIGTGWEVPEGVGRYVATAQTGDGLVWHLFDGGRVMGASYGGES